MLSFTRILHEENPEVVMGYGSFGETDRRPRRRGRRARVAGWAAGLASVAAAGLLAAAPANALIPPRDGTVFVHSAGSGELRGGRLILHGVKPRVTWAHNSGRSGVVRVKRLHGLLFSRAKPAATGTLHVAGHRGGDELTFKLRKPRHNASRRTVSYRAEPLNDKPLPSRAAGAAGAARRFGAASLSMVAAPTPSVTVTNNYSDCNVYVRCWTGTVSASGLEANASVTVFAPLAGQPDEGYTWHFQADKFGNIDDAKTGSAPCRVNPSLRWVETIHVSGGGLDQDLPIGCPAAGGG